MTLLRSPGYATDLVLLAREGGVVEEHDDHLVVRTPANPTYHWGNCLILRRAPEPGTLADWLEVFRAAHPGALHVAIGIDDPTADPSPDEAVPLGLDIERDMVLTAASLAAGPAPAGVRLAWVEPDDDDAWGRQTPETWGGFVAFLQGADLLEDGFDTGAAWTNDYLPER